MAEAANDIMLPEDLMEIYLTAALRVKKSYPKIFKFFCRYYLSKARQASSRCSHIPAKYQWAFTSYGYRFLMSHQVKYDPLLQEPTLFSKLGNKSDPISYILRVRLK